jgi:DNA-binding beta-propeller fold protein YncE
MTRPKGVAVDSEGIIYVVESYYDHLLIFDADGKFLLPIGGSGYSAGTFFQPAGIFVDPSGMIYVADMFNGRVAIFQYLGDGIDTL